VICVRDGPTLTVIEPFMHSDLLRKEKRRKQKNLYRKTSRATARETSHGQSRTTTHETSHEKARETAVLPPSSFLSPSSSPSSTPSSQSESVAASPVGDARPAEAGPGPRSDQVEAVIAHYRKLHPRARPGEKERRLISARLKDGFTVEDLIQAINGNHASPFHRGENARNRPFQSLELIVRDAKHVQDFVEVLSTIETPTPGIDVDAVRVMARRIGLDETLKTIGDDQSRSLTNGSP